MTRMSLKMLETTKVSSKKGATAKKEDKMEISLLDQIPSAKDTIAATICSDSGRDSLLYKNTMR